MKSEHPIRVAYGLRPSQRDRARQMASQAAVGGCYARKGQVVWRRCKETRWQTTGTTTA